MLSLLWLGFFFFGQYLCFKYCGSFNILNILFDLFDVIIIIFNIPIKKIFLKYIFFFALSINFPLTHVVSCHISPHVSNKRKSERRGWAQKFLCNFILFFHFSC